MTTTPIGRDEVGARGTLPPRRSAWVRRDWEGQGAVCASEIGPRGAPHNP
jgi:hypothetical protein